MTDVTRGRAMRDRERWFIQAESEEAAREKVDERREALAEVGISGRVEYEGVVRSADETVSFRVGEADDEVGAVYKFVFDKTQDAAQ